MERIIDDFINFFTMGYLITREKSKFNITGGRSEEKDIETLGHNEQEFEGEAFMRKYSLTKTDLRSKSFETKFSLEIERLDSSLWKPSLNKIMKLEAIELKFSNT